MSSLAWARRTLAKGAKQGLLYCSFFSPGLACLPTTPAGRTLHYYLAPYSGSGDPLLVRSRMHAHSTCHQRRPALLKCPARRYNCLAPPNWPGPGRIALRNPTSPASRTAHPPSWLVRSPIPCPARLNACSVHDLHCMNTLYRS